MIKIAIDAMGGDHAPLVNVEGAMEAVKMFNDLEVVLYGDESKLKPLLSNNERITIVHTDKFIDMGEKDPISIIRRDTETSLAKAMIDVKEDVCDAIVSAGPTQAVVAGAHIILRRLKGMKRTALCPVIPTYKKTGLLLLDVGANKEIRPEHLLQYAHYATIFAKEVRGIDKPKLALVNIGAEESKGRDFEKESYELLKNDKYINFIGNLEPKEMMTADVDICVTDGFTGNMVMKSFEGTAKLMGKILKEEIKRTLLGKIGAVLMSKNLKRFKLHFDPSEVGGASLFGASKTLIKAHGSSDTKAIKNAIKLAYLSVKGDVLNKVKDQINTQE